MSGRESERFYVDAGQCVGQRCARLGGHKRVTVTKHIEDRAGNSGELDLAVCQGYASLHQQLASKEEVDELAENGARQRNLLIGPADERLMRGQRSLIGQTPP